jgi:DNA-binding transcriptional ArsR family regulator
MSEGRKPMPETAYRASRWFRVLGNPMAYRLMRTLGARRLTVSELADELGAKLTTVSFTLRQLRQVDLVRYETDGLHKRYWVKDRRTLAMMRQVERMVDRMRVKAW